MNERIRELAEEHGLIHEYMTIGERNDALIKYKEFAELIIRECAQKLEDDGMVEVAMEIKQHFGVK